VSIPAVRDAMVFSFGPACAAWLVRDLDRRRKKARRRFDGTFDLHLGASEQEPEWFALGIAYLKKRARRWSVVVRRHRGTRHYRLTWIGSSKRDLPSSIKNWN